MEETNLDMIAELMSKQSGEKVDIRNIVKLPEPDGSRLKDMRNDRYDAYVARTETCTCLVYCYADGRIHVYVH